MKQKILAIYHRKDNDGYCCAAIFKAWCSENGHELVLVGFDYNDDVAILKEAYLEFMPHQVFMADVTLKPVETIAFHDFMHSKDKMVSFTIIDHHKRAHDDFHAFCVSSNIDFEQDAKIKNLLYFFDDIISACELCWKWLFQRDVPLIVEIIGTYDTFRGDLESPFWLFCCLPFQFGSRMYSSNNLIDRIAECISNQSNFAEDCISKGNLLRSYELMQNKRAEKSAFRIVTGLQCLDRDNLKIGIINSCSLDPSNFNPAGEYDMICVYYQKDANVWKYSLRPGTAKNDMDYSEIAAIYGGGGHAKAAGFTHDENIFDNTFFKI